MRGVGYARVGYARVYCTTIEVDSDFLVKQKGLNPDSRAY